MPGFGFCAWCRGFAPGVRLIDAGDQGSGMGQISRYACPTHIRLRGLRPINSDPPDAPATAAPTVHGRK